MVESKFVVFQMIPPTLFIEWDFGHCSLAVLLFMTLLLAFLLFMALLLDVLLYTSRWHCSWYCSLAVVKYCSHIRLFMYTILFIYTVLFIRPVFIFFSLNVHF